LELRKKQNEDSGPEKDIDEEELDADIICKTMIEKRREISG
jgi:hypothetical protein